MAKVLLVEDDQLLATSIIDWLTSQKYTVEVAHDGEEAEHLLAISSFDVLILDWALPFRSGIELCVEYRTKGGMAPILMLTGRGSTSDKETGLDSGADDYLTKPFDMTELSARLRALLRRPKTIAKEKLTGRGIEIDKQSWQVTLSGKPVQLFPKELLVLEFLMRHPNQVFSIEALQRRIWPSDSEASPETLRVHIARLRSKLEKEGEKPIIKTVIGQGYMFDGTP